MPRAIMFSLAVNSFMAVLMGATICFAAGPDPAGLLTTPTGYPFLQIFYNATGSLAGTNVMAAIVISCLGFCAVSEVATCSRQTWSFARDRGVPFARFFSHVHPKLNIPVRAVLISV